MWDIFSEKKSLRQRNHKLGASRNMRAIFLRKKAPAATYPQVRGFQDLGTKKKRRAQEAEPLGMQGGTGGLQAPCQGVWGGWKPPRNSWGAADPR